MRWKHFQHKDLGWLSKLRLCARGKATGSDLYGIRGYCYLKTTPMSGWLLVETYLDHQFLSAPSGAIRKWILLQNKKCFQNEEGSLFGEFGQIWFFGWVGWDPQFLHKQSSTQGYKTRKSTTPFHTYLTGHLPWSTRRRWYGGAEHCTRLLWSRRIVPRRGRLHCIIYQVVGVR